jgi:hypothetical protein
MHDHFEMDEDMVHEFRESFVASPTVEGVDQRRTLY